MAGPPAFHGYGYEAWAGGPGSGFTKHSWSHPATGMHAGGGGMLAGAPRGYGAFGGGGAMLAGAPLGYHMPGQAPMASGQQGAGLGPNPAGYVRRADNRLEIATNTGDRGAKPSWGNEMPFSVRPGGLWSNPGKKSQRRWAGGQTQQQPQEGTETPQGRRALGPGEPAGPTNIGEATYARGLPAGARPMGAGPMTPLSTTFPNAIETTATTQPALGMGARPMASGPRPMPNTGPGGAPIALTTVAGQTPARRRAGAFAGALANIRSQLGMPDQALQSATAAGRIGLR
jgi:hypothetical protein